MTNNENDNHLIEQWGDQGRVLKQARLLPSDKPLTDEQVAGVRSDYGRYTAEHGIFDAQVAKQLGIEVDHIKQFKAGQYKGDVEVVSRALNDWMEQHARKCDAQTPEGYAWRKTCKPLCNWR